MDALFLIVLTILDFSYPFLTSSTIYSLLICTNYLRFHFYCKKWTYWIRFILEFVSNKCMN